MKNWEKEFDKEFTFEPEPEFRKWEGERIFKYDFGPTAIKVFIRNLHSKTLQSLIRKVELKAKLSNIWVDNSKDKLIKVSDIIKLIREEV